jgi:PAS domain S-box-containing protein
MPTPMPMPMAGIVFCGDPISFGQNFMDRPNAIDYESIFLRSPVGMCISRENVILQCNNTLAAMFGRSRESLVGNSLCMLYPSDDEFERIGPHISLTIRALGYYSDERIMKRSGEELFWCRLHSSALQHDQPQTDTVWTFEDLNDKHRVTAELTPREREIATLLIDGKTSKVIAREIGLSPRTVDTHRSALMKKFSAANSSELAHRLSMSTWRTIGRGGASMSR